MIISKVISGGQSGVDQAGLIAARACGIPTGGTAPAGWRTDDGPAPWLADYGLIEHTSSAYPPRTEENVRNAPLTLILGNHMSPGCRLTKKLCNKHDKRYFLFPNMDQGELDKYHWFQGWHDHEGGPYVLNIAGNRESSCPGIHARATYFLKELFHKIQG